MSELQKERGLADDRYGSYVRNSLTARRLAVEKDGQPPVVVRPPDPLADEGLPLPVELRLEDVLKEQSRVMMAAVGPVLEAKGLGPQIPKALGQDVMDAVARREGEYWKRGVHMPIKPSVVIPVPKEGGGVSSVALSPSCTSKVTFLAAGTNLGGVFVWLLRTFVPRGRNLPLLMRIRNRTNIPRAEQVPITQLSFSVDGVSQLLGLDASGVVWLWSLSPPTTASEEPAKHTDAFRARQLAVRYRVDALGLTRVRMGDLGGKTVPGGKQQAQEQQQQQQQPQRNKSRTGDEGSLSGPAKALTPTLAAFHPAMSILGHQPCIMVSTASGLIVKINTDKLGGGDVGAVVYGESLANFDTAPEGGVMKTSAPQAKSDKPGAAAGPGAGTPGPAAGGGGGAAAPAPSSLSSTGSLAGGAAGAAAAAASSSSKGVGIVVAKDKAVLGPSQVGREFIEFHRCPLVFMGYAEHLSLDLVTLDEAGYMALWPYSDATFSGYKWFIPSKTAKLNLDLRELKPLSKEAQGKPRVLFSEVGLKW
jgi:hypothetical protein